MSNYTDDVHKIQVVKTKLETILIDKPVIKNTRLLKEINKIVIRCNNIIKDTYLFIKLYQLHLFENDLPLAIINEDFVIKCIKAISKKSNYGYFHENNSMDIFYEEHFKNIPGIILHDISLLASSNILLYIAKEIVTMINNNIQLNFIKRLFKYINIFAGRYYDENEEDENNKRNKLNSLKDDFFLNRKVDPIFKKWSKKNRDRLVPKEFVKNLAYDLKVDPQRYLWYFININRDFELENDKIYKLIEKEDNENNKEELRKKLIKLFHSLPLRTTNIPCYITFDTKSLIRLLLDDGTIGSSIDNIKLEENKLKTWKKFFRMDKAIFKDNQKYKFHYMFSTDGFGCSLLFEPCNPKDIKVKKNSELINDLPKVDDLSRKELRKIFKDKNIVCGDPGRKDLIELLDENGVSSRYGASRRKIESKSLRNDRILARMKIEHDITKKEEILSLYCSKTVFYDRFIEYIEVKKRVDNITRKFYEDEIHRKMKFRKYCFTKSSEDKFLNRIEETYGKDIVLVLGDWSNDNRIRGLAPTMGNGLKRLMARKFTTLLIKENNTSKLCSGCHNELVKMVVDGKSRHRILGCKICKEKLDNYNPKNYGEIVNRKDEINTMFRTHKVINRDYNACRNMINIVKHLIAHGRRPRAFI